MPARAVATGGLPVSVLLAPGRAHLGVVCLEGETEVGHRRVDGVSVVLDANGVAVRGPEPGSLRLLPWRALEYLRFDRPAAMADGRPAVALLLGTTGRQLRLLVPCDDLPPDRATAVAASLSALVARYRDGQRPTASAVSDAGPAPFPPLATHPVRDVRALVQPPPPPPVQAVPSAPVQALPPPPVLVARPAPGLAAPPPPVQVLPPPPVQAVPSAPVQVLPPPPVQAVPSAPALADGATGPAPMGPRHARRRSWRR